MKWVIGTNLNLKERTILYLSCSEFSQLQKIQALPNKFRFMRVTKIKQRYTLLTSHHQLLPHSPDVSDDISL